ncbi:MAG: OmpA family protein [Bacteroidales bacterium]|jgi:outer membrane protein OmpA-like peptidoglycan-associated protein|nr:OmpA family protein [Bacteroidales bacterium]
MKKLTYLIIASLMIISAQSVLAQETSAIISLYDGSKLVYDDDIGFETHYYLTGPNSHEAIDGKIRRQFCKAPEDVSAYEIIKNYEKAIQSKGGTIIHLSRSAKIYKDEETGKTIWFMRELFAKSRLNHSAYSYLQLPNYAQDYVVGKISTPENDIYISVAAAQIEKNVYYTVVTLLAEPMEMNKVTLNVLNEGIAQNGRVAIYDIYFDTGKSEVKDESTTALKSIADYLKNNSARKFLIVGHTDNTGDFDANIKLSSDRAEAVKQKLIADYNIPSEQLKTYGVGSTSPQMSNSTEDGKARNRRVELVEF